MDAVRVTPLPAALLGLILLFTAAALSLSWGLEPHYDTVLFAVMGTALGVTGVLIISKHPGHRMGWLFLLSGLLTTFDDFAQGYGLRGGEEGWAGAAAGQWFGIWSWIPQGFCWALLFLLFPTGRLLNRRWRSVIWAGLIGMALLIPGQSLTSARDAEFSSGSNPLAVDGPLVDFLFAVGAALFLFAILASVVSLVVRFRRSVGVERQQMKWLTFVAALTGVMLPLAFAFWYQSSLIRIVCVVTLTALPIAAGIAILRYRLYDIDVVINRTLVYGGLTLSLAAAYAVTTLLLGTALGGSSTLATAGATLVAAAAFLPLRRRLQDLVDRRFDRAGYDALGRVTAFMEDLRAGKADPDGIEALLAGVLRDPGLELRFFMPASELYVDRHGEPVSKADGDRRERIHISRAGAPVGIMLYDPGLQDDPALAARVAEAAKLPVEIARLHVELQRQLDEVKASRARIVAAGDEERRRIERNLHDGAQQRLVSVGLALRKLQHGLDPDNKQAVDATVDEVSAVIRELRELARGVRPAQLDHGLAPALAELAGRAPLAVKVDATSERFPEALEAAGYFIACEGLTNAIKHAAASEVTIGVARSNGSLMVSVADDGVGGAQAGTGSGLRGVRDRAVAHGGRVDVTSEAGAGTRLTAELPCG